MQKYFSIYLFGALLALGLTSCEDVIQIDLNSSDPRFVIEGSVTDQAGKYQVSIHKTLNFDQSNDFPAVSGALVSISDGTMTDYLTETTPGVYETVQLPQGTPGRTYQLRVEAEGKIFEALSQMPVSVQFDSLDQSSIAAFGAGAFITMIPIYTDPQGQGNNYRFVQWRNNSLLSDINVRNDRDNDGLRSTQPIFALDEEIKKGDTVTVEMQTIDRPVYKYFVALASSSGNGPNASVPANPDSNISGGALGYFSAHTAQRKTVIVQ